MAAPLMALGGMAVKHFAQAAAGAVVNRVVDHVFAPPRKPDNNGMAQRF